MSDTINLTGQVQYLRGLADGMELTASSKEAKLLLKLIETLGEFARQVDQLTSDHQELSELVDSIDETVGEMLLGEEEASSLPLHAEAAQEGSYIEYECPHCRNKVYYDAHAFALDANHLCPECGKSLFPEEEETSEP